LKKGLETPTPFLQVGKQIYAGKWEPIVGTYLLFDEKTDSSVQPPNEGEATKNSVQLSFHGKAMKKIRFEKVRLKPKDAPKV
jgi:hypothetical protein